VNVELRLGSESELRITAGDGLEITARPAAGGAMIRWLVDHLADAEHSAAIIERTSVFEILDEKCGTVPPGCDGLLCLPFQPGAGEGVPAAFVGLAPRHTRYHMARAVYEGSAFSVRLALEAARAEGAEPDGLHVTGPGIRSRLWLQIHADVCGLPVEGERPFRPDPARAPVYGQAYTSWRRALERLGSGERS